MINTLEKSARTVDAAIEEALKELGMSRDDVSVEILDMGKTGFLGFHSIQCIPYAVIKHCIPCQVRNIT